MDFLYFYGRVSGSKVSLVGSCLFLQVVIEFCCLTLTIYTGKMFPVNILMTSMRLVLSSPQAVKHIILMCGL